MPGWPLGSAAQSVPYRACARAQAQATQGLCQLHVRLGMQPSSRPGMDPCRAAQLAHVVWGVACLFAPHTTPQRAFGCMLHLHAARCTPRLQRHRGMRATGDDVESEVQEGEGGQAAKGKGPAKRMVAAAEGLAKYVRNTARTTKQMARSVLGAEAYPPEPAINSIEGKWPLRMHVVRCKATAG